jgi:hypothetical protein
MILYGKSDQAIIVALCEKDGKAPKEDVASIIQDRCHLIWQQERK